MSDFLLNCDPAVTEWDKHRRSRTWAECKNKAERIVTERESEYAVAWGTERHTLCSLYIILSHFLPAHHVYTSHFHSADECSCHLSFESLILVYPHRVWLFTGVSTVFYNTQPKNCSSDNRINQHSIVCIDWTKQAVELNFNALVYFRFICHSQNVARERGRMRETDGQVIWTNQCLESYSETE